MKVLLNRQACLIILSFLTVINTVNTQSILSANGQGSAYDLINSVLAGGGNVIEVPDCVHGDFGDHIDQHWDADLNKYVFRFHAHVDEDNDRCIRTDRQRTEIKTYDQSPDSTKAVEGEEIVYRWKFKLDVGIQASSNFTHIHQIKAVGGPEVSMPKITLTLKKSTPNRLQLRYAQNTSQVTVYEEDLTPFEGEWVQAQETILFGESGTYHLTITRISDGAVLFDYNNNNIRMWNTDAEFLRPKWGIYRSLNNAQDLRDEIVYFADFEIHEDPSTVVPDPVGAGTCLTFLPDNLQVSPPDESATLSWDSANNADHYKIRYRSVDSLTWITVPGSITTNSYTFTGLSSGTYEWQIRSKCSDGTGTDYNDSTPPNFTVQPTIEIQLALWLEGAYENTSGEMKTNLHDRGLLPGQTPVSILATPTPTGQPYNTSPWNYTGTEGIAWTDTDYMGDETDWVLVSFRTDVAKNTEVAMAAGLLTKNGTVRFPDRDILPSSAPDSLYIVVEHRNHMGIMTPTAIGVTNGVLAHDFRLSDSYRDPTSFGQKQLSTGEWSMYAGDADQSDFPSYDIQGTDKLIWFDNNGVFDTYISPDFNLDGDVNGQDKAIWFDNNGISSRVPR